MQHGKLSFGVHQNGKLYTAASPNTLAGRSSIEVKLERDGAMTLAVHGTIVARGQAPGLFAQQLQDELSIGQDAKNAVGDYQAPNPLRGKVEHVQVTSQQ